ncbi:MAG TPA: enoyl-CoA hydratase/isomerase family protein [Candidatus Limnocylindrales bacterium]|nr:enoyl-CoA hydratase/isomerase family protein [Candidatus Limnocylindrales bacterium]
MLSTNKVLLEIENCIATVTLNRPEKSNAFDGDVWQGLEEAASAIKHNPMVKAVIVTGAGRAFCSGLDIKTAMAEGISLDDHMLREGHEALHYLSSVFTMYENLPVPVIAAINGGCIGLGMELALACDIRIASEEAIFSIPEVVFGLIPDCGGTQRLPRLMNPGMAKELVLTGRRINASEALRIGLVNHLYPKEQLANEAVKIANEIIVHSPAAIQASKLALNAAMNTTLDMGLRYETAAALSVLGEKVKTMIKHNNK